MGTGPTTSIEIEGELWERAERAARVRGVEVSELLREALERELGSNREEEQPPLTCIGVFESGRGDLSARASRDEYEPKPSR